MKQLQLYMTQKLIKQRMHPRAAAIEQYSIDCRKSRTNVITLANHKEH